MSAVQRVSDHLGFECSIGSKRESRESRESRAQIEGGLHDARFIDEKIAFIPGELARRPLELRAESTCCTCETQIEWRGLYVRAH